MNKIKIVLGVFVVALMAMCGTFLTDVTHSSVFASEISEVVEQQFENEAGRFYGQGYYEVGQTISLKAEMNPGWVFDGWYEEETERFISTSLECNDYVVGGNVTIKPKYHKIEYFITFAESLYLQGNQSELKDFTYTIVNKTNEGQPFYYENLAEITVTIKDELFIYDLEAKDIIINGKELNANDIQTISIDNHEKEGFKSFTISTKICENIIIDIDYSYMYKLNVVSGNEDVEIREIINFVKLTDYHSQPDETEYVYLVREDKPVIITIGQDENKVYEFVNSQFQGRDPSIEYSQSYSLDSDKTFTVTYRKVGYTVSFSSYLINLYGGKDLIENPFYQIEDVLLTAGDNIGLYYDEDTKKILITDPTGTEYEYLYPTNLFGYRFVGFALNGEIINGNTYTLSQTAPADAIKEIELIFENIEYSFEIKLVDEYFLTDNTLTYSYTFDNEFGKLINGTKITLQASTAQYTINGWSLTNSPKTDGYLYESEDISLSEYVHEFKPLSDTDTSFTIYLDVDYKYLTANYNLRQSSIVENLQYDIVDVDWINNVIVFRNSEDDKDIISEVIESNANNSIITTQNFGDVQISQGQLIYTANQIEMISSRFENIEGVERYIFDKYTYFGQLKVGVVEYITLAEDVDQTTVVLGGTIYGDSEEKDAQIQTFTTTKVYDDIVGAYLLQSQYGYSMYLYTNDNGYDYIILRDIKYYFNGEKFVLNNAEINEPEEINFEVTKNSQYNIQLNNVLPNTVLVYLTKTSNPTNYRFLSFANKKGSTLWSFEYEDWNACILNINATDMVQVAYKQLSNNINLIIDNENAYLYDVDFKVEATDGAVTSGSGKVISAQDNETITITIVESKITRGYKFDNYMFNGEIIQTKDNPMVLTFKMDSRKYANQNIVIKFSPIQYTIKVNYIDSKAELIEQNQANGKLRFLGSTEVLESFVADINGEYAIEAVANTGYYVSNAYIGTDFTMDGLISNNLNQSVVTTWRLNNTNFEQAVIDNAGEENLVNIYVNFAIHTYKVKVYFEISSNASEGIFPTLYVNEAEQVLHKGIEFEDGVSKTKYFVEAEGFEYNSNVKFELKNYTVGTTILNWTKNNLNICENSQYVLSNISQDTTLKVVLRYITYTLKFVSEDEEGQICNYGSATALTNTIKLYDTVQYDINIELGYILKGKYYYNSLGEVGAGNIDSGFTFNPANFKQEENTIKIYLVFGLKSISLDISNTIEGDLYYFENQQISDLLNIKISRQRANSIDVLNNDTGYQVQTGDILKLEIAPTSIGLELSKVKLGFIDINGASVNPYKWSVEEIVEDDKLVGLLYKVEIEFTSSVISGLSDTTSLQNVLKVRTYNITYTYNYIDYKFGIRLVRQYADSTATGNSDIEMKVEDVGYGSTMMFSYLYEGMNTGSGAQFKVDGFNIEDIKQNVTTQFVFDDIALWETIALMKHEQASQDIRVVLVLKPKINLNNHTSYNEVQGYVYERAYIGENQFLTTVGTKPDVTVGGQFDIIIKYSYDYGVTFIDQTPINVGEYPVKIIAKINSNGTQITDVEFEESVTYIITPASLTISLNKYNSINPITKTYDGNASLASSIIVSSLVFDGVYPIDKNNIFVDENRLRAEFDGVSVNSELNLYDVKVYNIFLLDRQNKDVKNYTISSGENIIFTKVGKINPKSLMITGFIANNKVCDGTTDVLVNIENIAYVGKLETDSGKILTENLKFYHEPLTELEQKKGKPNAKVLIDWSNALVGADSINYTVTYQNVYIDIHPYEISYELKGYGVFKIVDIDKLCLIPIGSKMVVRPFERGSGEYNLIYSMIEQNLNRGEKLKYAYEIIIQVDSINLLVPDDLYICLPKVNKVNQIFQALSDEEASKLEFSVQGEHIITKSSQGDGLLGVVVRTTYISLWVILLIIAISAVVIGLIVMIFIIVRRKTKQKYSRYDKI